MSLLPGIWSTSCWLSLEPRLRLHTLDHVDWLAELAVHEAEPGMSITRYHDETCAAARRS